MKNTKTNKWKNLLILMISIILIGGIVFAIYWFVTNSKNNQKQEQTTSIKEKSNYFNLGSMTGFISNNWELANDTNLTKNNVYNFDWEKLYKSDNKFNKLYIARNSISDHSLVGFDIKLSTTTNEGYNDFLRIGHLNALNFNLVSSSDSKLFEQWKINPNTQLTTSVVHAFYIASLINYFNFDVIGLTEINSGKSKVEADNFIKVINNICGEQKYDFVLSDNLLGQTNSGSGQSEMVCILYNTKTVNLNKVNNENGLTYENPIYILDKTSKIWLKQNPQQQLPNNFSLLEYYDYVRPPFGAYFNSKSDPNLKIATIFSHNDSPGAIDNTKEYTWKSQGSKELFEAYHIGDVLDWFNIQNSEFLPIYLGDTNIKTNNEKLSFNSENLNQKYSFAFEDNKYYGTSLTTVSNAKKIIEEIYNGVNGINSINKLIEKSSFIQDNLLKLQANPYDKIIFDNKIQVMKTNHENIIPLFSNNKLNDKFLHLLLSLINSNWLLKNNVMVYYERKYLEI